MAPVGNYGDRCKECLVGTLPWKYFNMQTETTARI